MAFYRYLDASLEHVTRKDLEILREQDGKLEATLIVYSYDQGFFIPISKDFDADWEMAYRNDGLSEGLINLLRLAVANDCALLRLDWDADIITGLPVYT